MVMICNELQEIATRVDISYKYPYKIAGDMILDQTTKEQLFAMGGNER